MDMEPRDYMASLVHDFAQGKVRSINGDNVRALANAIVATGWSNAQSTAEDIVTLIVDDLTPENVFAITDRILANGWSIKPHSLGPVMCDDDWDRTMNLTSLDG